MTQFEYVAVLVSIIVGLALKQFQGEVCCSHTYSEIFSQAAFSRV